MRMKALHLLAAAGLGLAALAHGQAAPAPQGSATVKPAAPASGPASAAGAPQKPLQLQTLGKPSPPQPIVFPPADPANFTASSPTTKEVNSFFKQLWGYDPNRVWKVEGIKPTDAPGVVQVTAMVGEQGMGQRTMPTSFFVTPDGKYAIAGGQVIPFGADLFSANRAKLEAGAKGPSKGAADNKLLLVEFSDLQCPHCKEAQPIMDHLAKDFPNARIVYENFPLTQIHPAAEKAAEYGVCVAKLNGNAAFFNYIQAVFDTQAGLTSDATDKTLQDAAGKAGADAAAVKKCASTPEAKAAVDASTKLATDLSVKETPTLFINGRSVPLNSVPYETLKQLVYFSGNEKPLSASAK